ncbi:hypothetical protein ANANG_G00207150 [Anguilla anguilla]|uniref:Uncharacterized protein n=1 Tax=Anguilla anguilla TaxID=7936 RepID=A0A9D3M129_ANGAN|nr:hypothetical protein ANANG_G00207150 [Anguilla anguilla]
MRAAPHKPSAAWPRPAAVSLRAVPRPLQTGLRGFLRRRPGRRGPARRGKEPRYLRYAPRDSSLADHLTRAPRLAARMRSLKHLKHHTRSNVQEDSGRLVGCYPKLMDGQADAGTQTDPVVVLSLAQAAVLGLISQNEVFGATIAPNGFYTGEARDGLPAAGEDVKYEYASQLIGANGDYLGEALEEDEEEEGEEEEGGPGAERRRARRARSEGRPGSRRRGPPRPRSAGEGEEGKPYGRGPCAHLHGGPAPGEGPYSVALKQEQPPRLPRLRREARAQEGGARGRRGRRGGA